MKIRAHLGISMHKTRTVHSGKIGGFQIEISRDDLSWNVFLLDGTTYISKRESEFSNEPWMRPSYCVCFYVCKMSGCNSQETRGKNGTRGQKIRFSRRPFSLIWLCYSMVAKSSDMKINHSVRIWYISMIRPALAY